jgi:sucrose phosphorylase
MRRGPQLITYPDSLGGSLAALDQILATRLSGLFSGVHILPPFPSSGDRGFAPTTYAEIDPRFGTWSDIARIATGRDVGLDLIVNHLSRRSAEFLDFERVGRGSPFADLFVTLDKLWPDGRPDPADLARIHLRRPRPWSSFEIAETGETETVWTTFGRTDPSEQIDLDVRSPATRSFIVDQLRRFAANRVRLVRLDAVGYVAKRPGTTFFMVEPEIDEFLVWAHSVAEPLGLDLLAEVHAPRSLQHRLATADTWVYDFVLPGLVLHAFRTASPDALADHLRRSPDRQITTLDTHDGIPVQPDLEGVVGLDDMKALVDLALRRGANLSRLYARVDLKDPSFDAHQMNLTYRAAIADDDAYVAARAIQLFAPGIPQVYYVGLLAGLNDPESMSLAGDGRAINRHDFSAAEIDEALATPLVGRILRLIRLRHDSPAFDGTPRVESDGGRLSIEWAASGGTSRLVVDLGAARAEVTSETGGGSRSSFIA